MWSALVWTGGLAGLLVMVLFTVFALGAIAAHRAWDWAALFAAIAMCGAGAGYAAHRWIQSNQRRRLAQRWLAAADWTGTELTTGLRWGKWLLVLGLSVGFVVAGAAMVTSSNPKLSAVGAVLALLFGLALPVLAVAAASAVRAGYFLRLDPLGIHCSSGVTVPWRDVLAMHLRMATFEAKATKRTTYALVAFLQPHASPAGFGGIVPRLIGPRLEGRLLVIPLGMAAADPELVLQAARLIGGRAGVPVTSLGGTSLAGVPA
jgi:hypothetical protein